MGRTRSEPNRDFYAAVGRKITEARRRSGLTQEALAARISLTRTSVINIEKGRQQLLVHMLIDIARALQVSATDIVPELDREAVRDIDALMKESGIPKKGREWITGG